MAELEGRDGAGREAADFVDAGRHSLTDSLLFRQHVPEEWVVMDTVRVVASRRLGTLSPLRYPGGKSALAGLFADLISELRIPKPRYVEPYAGGAGAGVALLVNGLVDELVINDIDPAVHAFWKAVVQQNERFVERVLTVALTIEEWKTQKEIYRSGDQADAFDYGFSFFYLNRTNRSGVLNAGVIGGQSQTGTYKIDARFNRDTLATRLLALARRAGQIRVTDLDGRTVIRTHAEDVSVFMYIDPPYVAAGAHLYLNCFAARDHRALAETVAGIGRASWLLTYDRAELIERLYASYNPCHLLINYSAHTPGPAEELLIASENVRNALSNSAVRQRSLQTPPN